MTAALLWARAEWRRRWVALLTLALFLAVGAGVVLTVAAGARRTATAYDRLVEATNRYDVYVQDDGDGPGRDSVVDVDLGALPGVLAADKISLLFTGIESDGGGELLLAGGVNGVWGSAIDLPRVTRGRVPADDRPDEILVNDQAARTFGLDVGDIVPVATFTAEQIEGLFTTGQLDTPAGPVLELQVVGIGRLPDDLDNPDAAGLMSAALASSAEEQGIGGLFNGARADLVDARPETVDAFVEAVQALPEHDPDTVYFSFGRDDSERVIDGVVVQSTALWAFAAAALCAGLLAVGQALARQVQASGTDHRTLLAIGAPVSARTLAVALPFVPAVLVGAVIAVGAAYAASWLMPTGLAKRAEPDPGLLFDAPVLLGGALVIAVGAVAGVFVLALRTTSRGAVDPVMRPSGISRLITRLTARPAAVTGLRMALDPGRGARRAPVASTLFGVGAGVAFVVGSLVFGSSLEHLTTTPRLYGTPWDLVGEGGESLEHTRENAAPLLDDDRVTAIGAAIFREIEVDGLGVQAAAMESLKGTVDAEPLAGRTPETATEIALGPRTMDRIGASIGDEVEVRGGEAKPRLFTVVGTIITSAEDGEQLGSGALMTWNGLEGVASSDGYTGVLIDVADGVDVDAVLGDLPPEAGISAPEPPAAVSNLDLAKSTPVALALFLALLAVAAAAHGITTAATRRRRDLAVMRAMGFVRGQVREVIAWQATAVAAVAVVTGVPLGFLAGRQIWRVVAERMPVFPEVDVPVVPIVAVVIGAFAVANVIAIPPAVLARRVRAAHVLRAE